MNKPFVRTEYRYNGLGEFVHFPLYNQGYYLYDAAGHLLGIYVSKVMHLKVMRDSL